MYVGKSDKAYNEKKKTDTRVDLFPYKTTDSEGANCTSNTESKQCHSTPSNCCSIRCCNHTVTQQVQYFINADNIFG